MARELRAYSATVPAGTLITAPAEFDLSFDPREVRRIEIDIPPGPRGEVGFYLAVSGQRVIPFNGGQWIVANDEHLGWDTADYPDSGSWQLFAYNTGYYPHTLGVRFHVDLPAAMTAGNTLTPPIPVALINAQAG